MKTGDEAAAAEHLQHRRHEPQTQHGGHQRAKQAHTGVGPIDRAAVERVADRGEGPGAREQPGDRLKDARERTDGVEHTRQRQRHVVQSPGEDLRRRAEAQHETDHHQRDRPTEQQQDGDGRDQRDSDAVEVEAVETKPVTVSVTKAISSLARPNTRSRASTRLR
jgi:hypothetical protein